MEEKDNTIDFEELEEEFRKTARKEKFIRILKVSGIATVGLGIVLAIAGALGSGESENADEAPVEEFDEAEVEIVVPDNPED